MDYTPITHETDSSIFAWAKFGEGIHLLLEKEGIDPEGDASRKCSDVIKDWVRFPEDYIATPEERAAFEKEIVELAADCADLVPRSTQPSAIDTFVEKQRDLSEGLIPLHSFVKAMFKVLRPPQFG